MVLIDRTGFTHDDWVRLADEAPATGHSRIIVSLSRYLAAFRDDPGGHAVGVALANDAPSIQVSAWLDELALIAIDFPSSADGRGFSLARQLRRLGFEGELRASGVLIADQFAFALRCGFDTVEIPAAMAARQPQAQWLAALDSIDDSYQIQHRGLSIIERRAMRCS